MTLRVALVGGPMYDGLYALLPDDAEIVVHAPHPDLNRAAAEMLAAGERIDVLSTHSKYAPSQSQWLQPLDGLLSPDGLAPCAVDLCRHEGALLAVPRNVDVRVLWVRRDLVEDIPATWDELDAAMHSFGFPGRESGLFGTFFELVVGAGAEFYEFGPPAVDAVARLCRLRARAPEDLPAWHYDEVDAALGDGRVAMAAAWPGATAALRASRVGDRLAPARYPSGPCRWVSYGGCHAWAIPTSCGNAAGAASLIERLSSAEGGRREAASGAVTAHVAAYADVAPTDQIDAARLALLRETIDEAMITYPPHPRFPELEDAGWVAIHRALKGEVTPDEAVASIAQVAAEVLT